MIVPMDKMAEAEQMLEALKRGENSRRIRTVRVRKDGQLVHISEVIFAVRQRDGRIIAMSSMERDPFQEGHMTEGAPGSASALQEQAQQLAQANQRKNDFLALLGHELRNPLASIDNAVHLLQLRDRGHDQHVQQALQLIGRQVSQLTRLADDVLDIGRITSGKLKLERTILSISEVISNAVTTVRPDADAHQHRLSVSLPTQPVFVYADATRLEQVFTNLLGNAIKYTEDGGQIWLKAQQAGPWIMISVKDNGIGIEPQMLPHIFDKLSQSDSNSLRSRSGLGLGLALVRHLVAMHGGSVHAVSAGRGGGSEFRLRLPASNGKIATPSTAEAGNSSFRAGLRILVVDDEVDLANSLGALLTIRGHQVKVVYDGGTALDAARTFKPQVVFLDIGLPHMDGYEVARRLRAEGAHDQLLVALTGYELQETRLQQAGVDKHLLKPTSLQSVEALLSAWRSR